MCHSKAREELGEAEAAAAVPGGADGKQFSAPAFTKTYDVEAKVSVCADTPRCVFLHM